METSLNSLSEKGIQTTTEETKQQIEIQKQRDATVIVLLPGILSPGFSMTPLQLFLQHKGYKNTASIDLNWSVEKFDKLVGYAVRGIVEQLKVYKKKHQGNGPQNLVVIGYSNGGSVGARAIEVMKEEGTIDVSPKLITLATPAKGGERTQPLAVKAALSLADSYRNKPDVTFPREGWFAVYSEGDEIVNAQRTAVDEKGNRPQEYIATAQRLNHFQMINPLRTGSLLVNILDKIITKPEK